MYQESVLWHLLSLWTQGRLEGSENQKKVDQSQAVLKYQRGWVAIAHTYHMVVVLALSKVLIIISIIHDRVNECFLRAGEKGWLGFKRN